MASSSHSHQASPYRRIVATAVLTAFLAPVLLAVYANKALYVGGTISGIGEKTEGRLVTVSEEMFIFDGGSKGGSVSIPYAAVSGLEYGQKAGRRVGVAILVSPLALFSKKRKHYLTLSYKDKDGKEQAGVFELGKDIVRTTLKILEVRTGKAIDFQDKEACQQFKTPKECDGK